MKYIKVEWPEIQDYWLYGQNNIVDYDSYCYFDPVKNCWFVPEDWEPYNSDLLVIISEILMMFLDETKK